MGYNGVRYLTDFWKYDPTKNLWSLADSFPGTPRAYNICISDGKKGYVGLGYDGKIDLKDFWEYDPSTDKWTRLPDFPGGVREMASAFVIGSDIYVGTGYDRKNQIFFNDFYRFSNGEWKYILNSEGIKVYEIANFSGTKRRSTQTIELNGKGYIISGFLNGILQEFHEYNPSSNSTTQLDELNDTDNGGNAAVARYNASVFVSESKIYLVGGTSGSTPLASCFEWNPTSKIWTEKNEMETGAREGAGCFVINGSGYLVGGRSGNIYYDDCIKFDPLAEKNIDD